MARKLKRSLWARLYLLLKMGSESTQGDLCCKRDEIRAPKQKLEHDVRQTNANDSLKQMPSFENMPFLVA